MLTTDPVPKATVPLVFAGRKGRGQVTLDNCRVSQAASTSGTARYLHTKVRGRRVHWRVKHGDAVSHQTREGCLV